MTYGGPRDGAASSATTRSSINSFSKYYSMTGWRFGWLVVPPDLVRPVERLSQNLFISPPSLPQCAAVAAFDAKDELERQARYAANRELLLPSCRRGFDELLPADGAFYVYA